MTYKTHPTAAFSLVEVTLALGVAAFALVAIFGLLPVGLNTNQASIDQTAATNIATRIASDLRAKSKTIPSGNNSVSVTPFYQIQFPASGSSTPTYQTLFLGENGSIAQSSYSPTLNQPIDLSQNPRYRVTVVFTPPSASYPKTATMTRIFITWPALVDKTVTTDPGSMPKNYSGSFDTVIALDRN